MAVSCCIFVDAERLRPQDRSELKADIYCIAFSGPWPIQQRVQNVRLFMSFGRLLSLILRNRQCPPACSSKQHNIKEEDMEHFIRSILNETLTSSQSHVIHSARIFQL